MVDKYYNIAEDVARHPHAWLYIIVGGRGRGKTYSTLLDCLNNQATRDFIFIKRTMDDVDMLCTGSGSIRDTAKDYGVNVSPFSAINRDTGSDIRAFSIRKGIGGFWHTETDDEGKLQPVGAPIGTAFALNGVTKYKGFELASNKPEQWMIFDEFIPNIYDRVNINEGKQLLDFYMTVSRDRVQRGLQEIKLICLANATNISNPLFQELEITDLIADMATSGTPTYFDPERLIYIHLLEDNDDYLADSRETGIYKALKDTRWGKMTYSNEFAYNDFSSVKKSNLKNYKCVVGWVYKDSNAYVYYHDGHYFITSSRTDRPVKIYNLDRENEQKAFFNDWVITLRTACIYDLVLFQKYSFYDLLVNYKKIFKI